MAENKVRFLRGTAIEYANAVKDDDTFYYTTDDGKFYIGDKEITNAEAKVQSDWNETDTTSDAYIKNKPTSLPANGGNADTVGNKNITDLMNLGYLYSDRTPISSGNLLDIQTPGKYVVLEATSTDVLKEQPWTDRGYFLDVYSGKLTSSSTANCVTQIAMNFQGWIKQRYIVEEMGLIGEWENINDGGNADTLDGLHANEIASNPNLLINPDFRINQRGQTAYTTTGYTVDRWLMQVGFEITPLENGIRICPTRVPTSNLFAVIQHIPVSRAMLGNNYTLTVNVSATNDYAYAAVYAYDSANTVIRLSDKIKLHTGLNSTTIRNIPDNTAYIRVQFTINSGAQTSDTLEILWTKLELGGIATLYTPPDPATELAKCQRYYQVRSTNDIAPVDLRPSMETIKDIKLREDGNYEYIAELW